MEARQTGRKHAVIRHRRFRKNNCTGFAQTRDRRRVLGSVVEAAPAQIEEALARATRAASLWDGVAAAERARCLTRAAELYESHMATLMAIIVREGGRTIPDALAEVREAVDYCRYYALRACAEVSANLPCSVLR